MRYKQALSSACCPLSQCVAFFLMFSNIQILIFKLNCEARYFLIDDGNRGYARGRIYSGRPLINCAQTKVRLILFSLSSVSLPDAPANDLLFKPSKSEAN